MKIISLIIFLAFTMRKQLWVFLNLVTLHCFLVSVCARKPMMQEKAEATIPLPTLSPPEGNTTFLGDTTWCVARPGASQADLKIALDWACGFGKADCGPIQAGGPCFKPDTLFSHASYAFNSYYQQNGNSDIACYFGGTAALTRHDPSYGRCAFADSGSIKSSAASSSKYKANNIVIIWWKINVILLFLYFARQ